MTREEERRFTETEDSFAPGEDFGALVFTIFADVHTHLSCSVISPFSHRTTIGALLWWSGKIVQHCSAYCWPIISRNDSGDLIPTCQASGGRTCQRLGIRERRRPLGNKRSPPRRPRRLPLCGEALRVLQKSSACDVTLSCVDNQHIHEVGRLI